MIGPSGSGFALIDWFDSKIEDGVDLNSAFCVAAEEAAAGKTSDSLVVVRTLSATVELLTNAELFDAATWLTDLVVRAGFEFAFLLTVFP